MRRENESYFLNKKVYIYNILKKLYVYRSVQSFFFLGKTRCERLALKKKRNVLGTSFGGFVESIRKIKKKKKQKCMTK